MKEKMMQIFNNTKNGVQKHSPEILAGVGVVVPGLLAHTFYKQGIKLTVLSSMVTSVAIFGVIQLASILNFI